MRADGWWVVYFDGPACGSLTTHTVADATALKFRQALWTLYCAAGLGSFDQSTHMPAPHLVQPGTQVSSILVQLGSISAVHYVPCYFQLIKSSTLGYVMLVNLCS